MESMRNSLAVVILPVFLILAACMNVEPVKARAAVNETVPAWAAMNETLSAWAEMNETLPASSTSELFKLVLQWPGSYAQSCVPSATSFSIHGLWQDTNSQNSHNCRQVTYNPTNNLRRTLNSKWPSLNCDHCHDPWFWNHEWKTHGVYGPFNCNQDNYIRTTLRLREMVNHRVDLPRLRNNGIYPSDSPWMMSQIHFAFNGVGGPVVRIKCDHQNQLFEIHLCFTFDRHFTFSSCPGNEFIRCRDGVLFLPPKQVAKCTQTGR